MVDPYLREAFDRTRRLGSTGPLVLGGSLSAIVVVALIDALTGTHVSMAVLYVVPVGVLAWYIGRPGGHTGAVLAGAAELLADRAATNAAGGGVVLAWNALSVVVIAWIVAEVLTRLHRALDAERGVARTDSLTGVANGRAFTELAEAEIERVRRYGGMFTLAFLDLDHFKDVNDTLGHHEGDRLLRDVALTLRTTLRSTDVVARIGGDEFVVLMPETGCASASAALEHVRDELARIATGPGRTVRASIGSVTFHEAPNSLDDALHHADTAMYEAKNAGRDRVVCTVAGEQAG